MCVCVYKHVVQRVTKHQGRSCSRCDVQHFHSSLLPAHHVLFDQGGKGGCHFLIPALHQLWWKFTSKFKWRRLTLPALNLSPLFPDFHTQRFILRVINRMQLLLGLGGAGNWRVFFYWCLVRPGQESCFNSLSTAPSKDTNQQVPTEDTPVSRKLKNSLKSHKNCLLCVCQLVSFRE